MSTRPTSKMHQRVRDAAEGKTLGNLGGAGTQVAKNSFWDDANTTYLASVQALSKSETYLLSVLEDSVADPVRSKMIKNPGELAQAVNILNRDLTAHHERLDGIYARHKDNKGGAKTMHDIQEVLAIQDEYTTAANIFSNIIVRDQELVLDLLGITEEAAQYVMNTPIAVVPTAQELAADPNVITDIEIKSEPVVTQPSA